MMPHIATRLKEIYDRLWQAYGPQQWWPADGPLEVMVGAVLTQNTTWHGAEKAIANLKRSGLLSVERLNSLSNKPPYDFVQRVVLILVIFIKVFVGKNDLALILTL